MEDVFKRNLLNLRAPVAPRSFAEALMGTSLWNPSQNLKVTRAEKVQPEEYSEKKQVIESLERFAQEKTAELNSPIIKIDGGGELALKPIPGWDDIDPAVNLMDLKLRLSIHSDLLTILLDNKDSSSVKVIFVTERFRDWKEIEPELKSGFINELLVGFPAKTAELFEKMIGAMKLTPNEVVLYPVESEEKDLTAEVIELAGHFKPEVIITLGAKATNLILKSNDRLSLIHGQFFQRTLKNVGQFQIVPLFHPSIIETNQNMKKTAWADMQKIMKVLKKLP